MLFAALSGTQADGMTFVGEALARGAVAVLAGESAKADTLSVPVLHSAEAGRALAYLAARFYAARPEIVAAVTGTNGKTSVAAFLRQIWTASGFEAASLGTVGIVTSKRETVLAHTTPDPVTLHKYLAELAADGVTHLAIEASSHGLDQHRLDGVRFSAGAFTNITRDHLDYHRTFEDYFQAKLRLFRELLPPGAPAVIDADSPGAEQVIEASQNRKLNVFTVGQSGQVITLNSTAREGFQATPFRHLREPGLFCRASSRGGISGLECACRCGHGSRTWRFSGNRVLHTWDDKGRERPPGIYWRNRARRACFRGLRPHAGRACESVASLAALCQRPVTRRFWLRR